MEVLPSLRCCWTVSALGESDTSDSDLSQATSTRVGRDGCGRGKKDEEGACITPSYYGTVVQCRAATYIVGVSPAQFQGSKVPCEDRRGIIIMASLLEVTPAASRSFTQQQQSVNRDHT